MEIWGWIILIFFTFYVLGTIHDFIQEKKNLKQRTIADLAAEKRLKQENKQTELLNKKAKLYNEKALIQKLINKANLS